MANPKKRIKEFEDLLAKKLPGATVASLEQSKAGWRVVVSIGGGRTVEQPLAMDGGLGRQDINAVAQIRRKMVEP